MSSMSRILALVVKEFLALLKDTKSRVVIIVPPIIQLLVFGYAATFDLEQRALRRLRRGRRRRRARAARPLRGSPNFQQVARDHRDERDRAADRRKEALLVLHIGPRFSRDLSRGRRRRCR